MANKNDHYSDESLIRHGLRKILASPAFRRCPKLQRFLEVTVNKTLDGKNEEIKEYTIGIEAFGKAADFDPTIDNIVRVQAGNLRRRLADYYATTGKYDPIEIRYETGDYKPRFLPRRQDSQPPPAIAIMPIVADNARNRFFGQGLSDELSHVLARSPELRVVAHGSALAVREEIADEQAVAGALNVELLVNGSLVGTGLSRRVRMNLFDATKQAETWSHEYVIGHDGRDDQIDLSRAVASDLPIPGVSAAFHDLELLSGKAADYHLRARALWSTRTPIKTKKAIRYLKTALELDPRNARIHGALANMYASLATYSVGDPHKYYSLARDAAERIPPPKRTAEAHIALAIVAAAFDWQIDAAERYLNLALDLAPDDPQALRIKAVFTLLPYRKVEESLECLFLARAREPVLDLVFTDIAGVYNARGEYEQALVYCDIAIENNPRSFRGRWMRALTLECMERFNEAISEFELARKYSNSARSSSLAGGSLTRVYALAGDLERARAELRRMKLERRLWYVSAYDFALAYSGLGQRDLALAYLAKAVSERCTGLTFLGVDPRWNGYRRERQFQELLAVRGL